MEEYKKDDNLSVLSVPAFKISNIDIEMKFTVTEPEDEDDEEIRVGITSEALKDKEAHQVHVAKFSIKEESVKVHKEDEEDED
ncbi:hypothetical protein ES705_49942 [subsurface metagenome]